jgi:hypothetical protein
MLPEAHDRALAVLLLDLLKGDVQHPLPFHAPYLLVRRRREASVQVRHNLHPCDSTAQLPER